METEKTIFIIFLQQKSQRKTKRRYRRSGEEKNMEMQRQHDSFWINFYVLQFTHINEIPLKLKRLISILRRRGHVCHSLIVCWNEFLPAFLLELNVLLVSRFIFFFSFNSNMNEVIMQFECLIRNSSVAFNHWVGGRSFNKLWGGGHWPAQIALVFPVSFTYWAALDHQFRSIDELACGDSFGYQIIPVRQSRGKHSCLRDYLVNTQFLL